MKYYQDHEDQPSAAPGASAFTDILSVATDLLTGQTDQGQKAVAVVDGAKIKANYDGFNERFSNIKAIVDFDACGSGENIDLVAFLRDLGVGLFSVKNKLEIERAVAAGVSPVEMAFLNPCKPASQIKYALNQGLHIIGCSSKVEVDKINKAKRQSGRGKAVKVILMIDPQDPQPLEELRSIIKAVREGQDDLVGISLYGEKGSLAAFTKAVAISRLLMEEVGGPEGTAMVFDLGQLDEEEEDYAAARVAAVARAQLMYCHGGIQLMAHCAGQLLRSAVATAVPIIHCVHSSRRGAQTQLVVNESIYGAFNRVMIGEEIENPVLIKGRNNGGGFDNMSGSTGFTYDVIGCSGDDIDVIKKSAQCTAAARAGDWLLFPNLFSGSSVHVALPAAAPSNESSTHQWIADNVAELEDLFSLPDLTEENLEFMFNI